MCSIIYPQIHILPIRDIVFLPTWRKWTVYAALLTPSTHFCCTKVRSCAFSCHATCRALWRCRLLHSITFSLKCRHWKLRILGSKWEYEIEIWVDFLGDKTRVIVVGLGLSGRKPTCWDDCLCLFCLIIPHLFHWSMCCVWWFALYC